MVALDSSYFGEPINVDKLVQVLNNKDWDYKSHSFQLTNEERTFINILNSLMLKDYQYALSQLSVLDETGFECQVKLLKVDCAYFLKLSGDFRQLYQSCFDCTESNQVKNLIKQRFRLSLYGF
jgi:hypothetical protein